MIFALHSQHFLHSNVYRIIVQRIYSVKLSKFASVITNSECNLVEMNIFQLECEVSRICVCFDYLWLNQLPDAIGSKCNTNLVLSNYLDVTEITFDTRHHLEIWLSTKCFKRTIIVIYSRKPFLTSLFIYILCMIQLSYKVIIV